MTVDADGNEFTCEAGRLADFGGQWILPCQEPYSDKRHVLITAFEQELVFCEKHMRELIDAGLITDPYVSPEGAEHLVEQERREVGRPLFGPWGDG